MEDKTPNNSKEELEEKAKERLNINKEKAK